MFVRITMIVALLLTIEKRAQIGSINAQSSDHVTLVGAQAQDLTDLFAARQQASQQILERQEFRFPETSAGVLFSISQYSGNCQIHMIYDRAKHYKLTFKFVRGGKNILEVEGHTGSTFRTVNNVLYFAHFSPSSDGCTVTAHDLDDGRKLWETKLKAVGGVQHSGYSNQVAMGFSSLQGLDKKGEGIVSIIGREGYGDYIEVLDRKTGSLFGIKSSDTPRYPRQQLPLVDAAYPRLSRIDFVLNFTLYVVWTMPKGAGVQGDVLYTLARHSWSAVFLADRNPAAPGQGVNRIAANAGVTAAANFIVTDVDPTKLVGPVAGASARLQ